MNGVVRVRRILVALDASPDSSGAMEAGAELAQTLKAELEGLFVEDPDLLALSDHPLARVVDPFTGGVARIEGPLFERRLRAQASRIRALMRQAASRRGIRWSFRVERGGVVEALRRAAGSVDVLTIGRAGWNASAGKRVGGVTRALLARGPAALLIRGRGAVARRAPVVCLCDGTPAARAALALAAELVRGRDVRLRVVLRAEADESATRLENEVVEHLRGKIESHQLELSRATGPASLHSEIETTVCSLLVLPMDHDRTPEQVSSLIERLDCPVLVLRARRDA